MQVPSPDVNVCTISGSGQILRLKVYSCVKVHNKDMTKGQRALQDE